MASIKQMSLGVSSIVEVSVNKILTSSRIANRVHVYDWIGFLNLPKLALVFSYCLDMIMRTSCL